MSPLTDPQDRPPLAVALAIDGWRQPRWIERLVNDLETSELARLCAVVVVARQPAAPPPLPRRLYDRLDRRLLGGRPDACAPADLQDSLGPHPRLVVGEGPDATPLERLPAELRRLADGPVDVLVVLTEPSASLAGAAPAVWRYRHGAAGQAPAEAGFWEVVGRRPGTVTELEQLDPHGGPPRVVARTLSPTDPLSPAQTRNHCLWKAPELVLRALRTAHAGVESGAQPAAGGAARPARRPSTPAAVVRLAARQAAFRLARLARYDQWQLVYSWDEEDGDPASFGGGRHLVPPAGRSWADPFPLFHDGRHYLFFEEYCHRTRKGHIAVAEIGRSGLAAPPVVALGLDHHLSYPFVFRWQDELWMLPEAAASRRLELYRCRRFPDRWQATATLLEGVDAVDATLHETADGWWLFTAIAVAGTRNRDELHLFRADSPLGPWRPHRANPVVSNARGARPGGRLLRSGGQLLRPGQDCARRYGAAVILHEVVRIDEVAYEERARARIEPSWGRGLIATHTFNRCRGLTVADAAVRRWRLPPTVGG